MISAGYVASATWPTLVNDHPLWLLGLSSLNRYLVATTPVTDFWPFLVVGTARLMLPDPFFYLLGWWYGDRGLVWLNHRFPSVLRSWALFEKFFRRFRYPAVFVAPNNAVCLLAGVDRMPFVPFLVTGFAGTVARILLIRATGDLFASPLGWVLDFVERWRWPLLAISVTGVVIGLLTDVAGRKGRARAQLDDADPADADGAAAAADPDGDADPVGTSDDR